MPNLLPNSPPWLHPAERLMEATALTLIGLVVVFLMMRRPRSEQPATWAMAMAGAVGAFAIFLLCYGVVPSEWLNFANSYLKWSSDKFIVKHNQFGTNLPTFDIPYSALKDAIAAGIYIVFFGLNIALWIMWQKRPTATAAGAEPGTKVIGTSRFGRPLKAKA